MTDKETKILEDFIQYKENQNRKWLVIDKQYVSAENYTFGQCEVIVTLPHKGSAVYEFYGDSIIGKAMELYEEVKHNDKR